MRVSIYKYIPHLPQRPWTWQRVLLDVLGAFLLIDSFFIPHSRDVDPGISGECIASIIILSRAGSRTYSPIPVLVAAGGLAALVSASNHRLLGGSNWLWVPLILICSLIVLFWGRRYPADRYH